MFHEGLSVKESLEQHLPCSHGHLGTEKIPSLLNAELKPVSAEMSCVVPPRTNTHGSFHFPKEFLSREFVLGFVRGPSPEGEGEGKPVSGQV